MVAIVFPVGIRTKWTNFDQMEDFGNLQTLEVPNDMSSLHGNERGVAFENALGEKDIKMKCGLLVSSLSFSYSMVPRFSDCG